MAFSEVELVFLALIFKFCFRLLDAIAGKRKQYLNSKENKKEEKGTQKSDTKTLPRPSVQESKRT